ncbi:MAG: CinA family nicotinamide mononucleotide deamidase-related protein [Pseudomonadales bacterium]|nr:CinA family nicotinamide mononucleotide deamidase-related protein [Pseudomonadales bacterium]
MNIQLLMTGNELMTGVTQDSNSTYIAEKLTEMGLSIHRIQTVGDNLDLLVNEIIRLSMESDILIINGGLGPTRDDLTAEALALASSQPLQYHARALKEVEAWCERRGIAMKEANRKQAYLPASAEILCNLRGSAPGIYLLLNNCRIFCTPGVPGEMKQMLADEVFPRITEMINTTPVEIRRFHLFGIGESALEQLFSENIKHWPNNVDLGYRAGAPTLEIKLTINRPEDKIKRDELEAQILNLTGDMIVAEGEQKMVESLVALLAKKQLKIATAESCTGGLIASMLTEVAGASAVFEAGIVSYSNRIKHELLDVDEILLEKYGAVSREVVLAMANGILQKSKADLVLAVSGIAGPDGGTVEKPVGTVWIAWGDKNRLEARELVFNYGRKMFQLMVSATALDLIRRRVLGIESEPRYFNERSPKKTSTAKP